MTINMKRNLLLGVLVSYCALTLSATARTMSSRASAVASGHRLPPTSFVLPSGKALSLPLLQWRSRNNSFSAQGIRTYEGLLGGKRVAYLSIGDRGKGVGRLSWDGDYEIASADASWLLTPAAEDTPCGVTGVSAVSREAGVSAADPARLRTKRNRRSKDEEGTSADDGMAEEAPKIGDGVFRTFRLAVYMSYNEFRSPKFSQDYDKVKAFWAQLETFLNDIYVRDLGVSFQIVADERLVEKSFRRIYTYRDGTHLIDEAIGEHNYDIGLLLDYADVSGIVGLARLGGARYDGSKGMAIVTTQSMTTMAHELGHLFGANHPFTRSVNLRGLCTEPGSGQSVVSYGSSSKSEFISLENLREMEPVATKAGERVATTYPNAGNTPPRIDRSRMRATYRVPQGSFFTIPVYASDAEQQRLLYSFNEYGCSESHPATFPVYAPQQSPVLEFGRKYNGAGTVVPHSENIPVGDYRFWLSVSDALPTAEAIERRQAPLYDGYIARVSVVPATPFKITSKVADRYATGDKLKLTWSVDRTFFPEGSRVRVVMSDDFGKTFRHVLVPSTANDGECEVFIPQQLMKKVATYSIVVPGTGERIDIWHAGEGVLRLETIDDDVRYYDFTSQEINGGGIEVVQSPVKFEGVPETLHVKLDGQAPMPEVPALKATADGRELPIVYGETQEGRFTTRTWTVEYAGKTTGVQQFIERSEDIVRPPYPGTDPTGVEGRMPAENVACSTRAGELTVSGVAAGATVMVYDTAGRVATSAVSRGRAVRFSTLAPGLYVVRVGGRRAWKVRVSE